MKNSTIDQIFDNLIEPKNPSECHSIYHNLIGWGLDALHKPNCSTFFGTLGRNSRNLHPSTYLSIYNAYGTFHGKLLLHCMSHIILQQNVVHNRFI